VTPVRLARDMYVLLDDMVDGARRRARTGRKRPALVFPGGRRQDGAPGSKLSGIAPRAQRNRTEVGASGRHANAATRFRSLLPLLAIAALLLVPRAAGADQAQAKLHYGRARTYFELREYRKALEEFKAAHVEKPDPAFLFNIAECHRYLGEPADALFFYR